MPKYWPYSWTSKSAAILLAPKSECFVWSVDIVSSMPRAIGVRGVDFVACVQLDERKTVRRVSVDLVRAREDEHGFRAIRAGRLEEVERSQRVHLKIGVRVAGGPVVRRLCSRMHDDLHVGSQPSEQCLDGARVANVEILVPIPLQSPLKRRPRGRGGRVRPEEHAPSCRCRSRRRRSLLRGTSWWLQSQSTRQNLSQSRYSSVENSGDGLLSARPRWALDRDGRPSQQADVLT